MSTTKRGLPSGGGKRSSHVGFNSRQSGSAKLTAINNVAAIQRPRESRPRLPIAYHANSPTVQIASVSQSEVEISG